MKAAVIGGGFAGIVAALALVERGHDVHLLERRGLLGGRATSYIDAASGDDVDSGFHFLLEGWRTTLEFLQRQEAAGFLLYGLRWPGASIETARAAWLREAPDRIDPAILTRVEGVLTRSEAAASPVLFRTGLGRLHEHLAQRFVASGGVIHRRALAERIEVESGRVGRVRFLQRAQTREGIRAGRRASRETLAADCVIAAVPWHALAGLLDTAQAQSPLSELARVAALPAVSIEAWLDEHVPLAALTSGPGPAIDWIADKSQLHGRPGAAQHLTFSVACAEAAHDLSNAEWTTLARRTLEAALAPARALAFQRVVVLREPAARYGCDTESSRLRAAAAETGIEGLFLAGDWTNPDLPACIEGAVQSGLRAAERAGRG